MSHLIFDRNWPPAVLSFCHSVASTHVLDFRFPVHNALVSLSHDVGKLFKMNLKRVPSKFMFYS